MRDPVLVSVPPERANINFTVYPKTNLEEFVGKLTTEFLLGRAKRIPHWGVQSRFRVIYVYVIARAGVIFRIYFTSCRYSGG